MSATEREMRTALHDRRRMQQAGGGAETEVSFPSWASFSFFYRLHISKGALLLELKDEVEIGAPVTVSLRVPGEVPLRLESVVKYSTQNASRGFLVGLQLTGMDDGARQALESLIEKHLRTDHAPRARTA